MCLMFNVILAQNMNSLIYKFESKFIVDFVQFKQQTIV